MATDRFSALEDRVNRAVLSRLCNAVALDVETGAEFGVIFDNAFALGGVGPIGMSGTQPEIKTMESSLAGEPVGKQIQLRGNLYTVAQAEPDGAGWTRLMLEVAA